MSGGIQIRRLLSGVLIALLAGVVGCGPGQLATPSGTPAPDPAALEATLRRATLPGSPQQVTFGWTLEEQGSRVRGEGVARLEAPERIRLDLFGTGGETYLVAALVGSDYRLPPQVAGAVALPSPSLLWSAIGVLEPPVHAVLSSAATTEGGAELRYDSAAGEGFLFTFEAAAGTDPRMVRVQRASSQGVVESVVIEHGADGAIARTRYRDWQAFRELVLDMKSIRIAESFPLSIWSPDASPQ